MPEDSSSANQLVVSSDAPSAASSAVVKKPGLSRSMMVLIGLVIVSAIGLSMLANPPSRQVSIRLPTTTASSTVPSSTSTTNEYAQPVERQEPLPDQGGMRMIVKGWLTGRCDHMIDGPEPHLTSVYEEHLACVEQELVKLEETCRAAARHYFRNPGTVAVEISCAEPPDQEV